MYSDVDVSYMLQPIIPVYVEKTQIVTEQHFLAVKLNADNNMFFWLIFLYLNSFEIWSEVR